ncbi:conjugal transfer protein TraP [Pantoea agglomerans]|uniref:conjugal transfer protein TraP n=1 Tax=Enterobacter agglomerans TaxID=549 RepID=UPI0024135461|nr:conjugal transfer protein TraP [Pantoea agglomerans]
MKAKSLSSLMYLLRLLAWFFHHLILLPAGTLLLLCLFLFWLEGSTPGRMMAAEITSVTQNVSPGRFRISGCEGVKDARQRNLCHQASITDAAGYAAHIDRSWPGPLINLWLVLALVSAVLSVGTGSFPVYWRNTVMTLDTRQDVQSGTVK